MEKSCSKHCFSTNVIIAALEGVLSLEPAQIPEVGSVERRTRTLTRRMTPPQSFGSRAPLSFGPRSFKKQNKKKSREKNFVSSWNISNWSMLQIRWRVCSTPRFSPVDLLLLCCAQQAKGKYSVLKYYSCHKAVYLAASAFLTMLNCIRMKCH